MGQHGKHRALVTRLATFCAGLALWAGSATAECRLALLLALDVSASVDARDYVLQRDGLARALDLPVIRNAILDGGPGAVALSVFEWSGRNQHVMIADWTMLDSAAAIDGMVARIAGHKRSYKDFPTAIGYALGFAAGHLAAGPRCDRQVIDVSGDGTNNEGFMPANAYAHFPFDGVTVNGLVIQGDQDGVVEFYNDHVLYGPDSFLEIAANFDDFEAAMGRKLFREINGMIIGSTQEVTWSPG